ncbi:ABC transporter ATP-binding protein [Haloarchaeobius litoreus]|uniref:ABC transporter ATP-binding protein n=1 Tax=Haloarchaeobius litoreus TaxID=755306 RepID=A0ABD6DPE7_9EURY|nr:ABC transporter ATP-binding protein [Haloarchaeobius litoreus]
MSSDWDASTATDTTEPTTPLLEIDGLEAGYETGQVLFDVDLAIDEGELVSLLGRNGAGKTTTMHAIMGADEPAVLGGDVRYRGESIVGWPSHRRANAGIAIVPEKRRCFPRLSVVENVRLAINHAENPLGLDEALAFFPELDDMRRKEARNMSGGEQQMLAIARALAANPDLMLLDEPFEGLAPYIVRRIEDIVADINAEQGITVFFVEQNVAAALAIADRHYVLDEGRIVDEVTSQRIREDAEFRQRYLGV